MRPYRICLPVLFSLMSSLTTATPPQQPHVADARLAELKQETIAEIDRMTSFTQQMVDQVFSFAELGFQEFETSRYVTGILKKNGFVVQEGVAGIPTAGWQPGARANL